MATTLKLRRGTTTQHASFTGAAGEVTVDTDKDVVVVHDGSTTGGFPAIRAGGALGTPSSGTVTNLTGTASININGTVGATTPASGSFTSMTDSGNLTFTGTGNRITGDFSNATIANRVLFQNSNTNSQTRVGVIPNGTSTTGIIEAFNSSDTTNASIFSLSSIAAEARLSAGIAGSGSYLPMTFYTNGSERMRIDSAGTLIIGSGEASATPVGNTLRAPNATGTNIAGTNLTIYAGNSTGNALGGYVGIGATSTPGASGTSENAQVDRMRVYSTSGAANGLQGVHIAQGGIYPATIPLSNSADKGAFTIHGTSEATANVQIINWGASTSDEPNLNFMALNGNTVGNFGTVPTSGFNLGLITFEGYSGVGSDMLYGATIIAEASGTWTSTTSPSLLRLQTSGATGSTVTRILIDKDAVSIGADTGFSISETTATTAALANAYIGNVSSGTYLPTITNSTNVAASTRSDCQFMRVGNMVTVSGQITIDVTTTATDSVLLMTLPIASTFTASRQCGGTGASSSAGVYGTETIAIMGNVAGGSAEFRLRPTSIANLDYRFSFTYQVL